jgi:hypothetical protein
MCKSNSKSNIVYDFCITFCLPKVLVMDFEQLHEKIDDEDKTIILLCSLATMKVYMSIWSRLELARRSPSKVVIILYQYWIRTDEEDQSNEGTSWLSYDGQRWQYQEKGGEQEQEDKYISQERGRISDETEMLKELLE